MKNIQHSCNAIGASLIEALITVSIVSIGTLSLTNLQTNLIRSNATSYQNNNAMTLADEKMEQLRNFTTEAGYQAIQSGEDNKQGSNASYHRSWTVTTHNNPNYKTISLNITWTKRNGSQAAMALDSQIAYYQPSISGKMMAVQSTPKITLEPPPSETPPNENTQGKNQGKNKNKSNDSNNKKGGDQNTKNKHHKK